MKHSWYRFIAVFMAFLLLTSCSSNPFQNKGNEKSSSEETSTETQREKDVKETDRPMPQEISVAGLPLKSYTFLGWAESAGACFSASTVL